MVAVRTWGGEDELLFFMKPLSEGAFARRLELNKSQPIVKASETRYKNINNRLDNLPSIQKYLLDNLILSNQTNSDHLSKDYFDLKKVK